MFNILVGMRRKIMFGPLYRYNWRANTNFTICFCFVYWDIDWHFVQLYGHSVNFWHKPKPRMCANQACLRHSKCIKNVLKQYGLFFSWLWITDWFAFPRNTSCKAREHPFLIECLSEIEAWISCYVSIILYLIPHDLRGWVTTFQYFTRIHLPSNL